MINQNQQQQQYGMPNTFSMLGQGSPRAQWERDRASIEGGRYVPGYQNLAYPSDMQGADSMTAWDNMNNNLWNQNQQLRGFEYSQERDAMFDAMEAERMARIQSALGAINGIFSGREPLYAQYGNEVFGLSEKGLNELNDDAARQLKFSLARSGTGGGSLDTDKYKQLADQYSEGLTQARSYADSMADQYRSQDSGLKASLMGLASSGSIGGPDITSMANASLSGMTPTAAAMPNLGAVYNGLYDNIGGAANPLLGLSGGIVGTGGQQGTGGQNPYSGTVS